jgi:hypothetical protein
MRMPANRRLRCGLLPIILPAGAEEAEERAALAVCGNIVAWYAQDARANNLQGLWSGTSEV